MSGFTTHINDRTFMRIFFVLVFILGAISWMTAQQTQRMKGKRKYEMGNHLGNVLATVTDRKIPVDDPVDGVIDGYEADVFTAQDYYAFGMGMPEKNMEFKEYRFGFNGMEKDGNLEGLGNNYTTLYRQYSPRLGRWKSLDPAMDKYPGQSPYVGLNNNPIKLTDPLGNDPPEKGRERATSASDIQSNDTRTYDQVDGSDAWTTKEGKATVDCSEFCREVAQTQGYDPGRTSRSQAKYYQDKGEWTTDVSEIREGDFIFWKNKGDINHTGIVISISGQTIKVAHAGEQKAKDIGKDGKGGRYEGGNKSLVTSTLNAKGGVWGKTFVGAGRPSGEASDEHKPALAISNSTEIEIEVQINEKQIENQVKTELLQFYQELLKEAQTDLSKKMIQKTINDLQK